MRESPDVQRRLPGARGVIGVGLKDESGSTFIDVIAFASVKKIIPDREFDGTYAICIWQMKP